LNHLHFDEHSKAAENTHHGGNESISSSSSFPTRSALLSFRRLSRLISYLVSSTAVTPCCRRGVIMLQLQARSFVDAVLTAAAAASPLTSAAAEPSPAAFVQQL